MELQERYAAHRKARDAFLTEVEAGHGTMGEPPTTPIARLSPGVFWDRVAAELNRRNDGDRTGTDLWRAHRTAIGMSYRTEGRTLAGLSRLQTWNTVSRKEAGTATGTC